MIQLNHLRKLAALPDLEYKGINFLALSNNFISDEGAKFLAELFIRHPSIKEIKLNGNSITDIGGEVLMYSVIYNRSITRFHIENNLTTWRENNVNLKNIRGDIQIFF